MSTYSDIYEAAYGQKLNFHYFVYKWLEEYEIYNTFQRDKIIKAICCSGWLFFEDELMSYFESLPESYKINEDGSVTVLEL